MLMLSCLVIICSLSTGLLYANTIPITLLNIGNNQYSDNKDKILKIVSDSIANLPTNEYGSVRVQIIHDEEDQPSALLVYLLSAKNYSFTIMKIAIDDRYQVLSVIPNYQAKADELSQSLNTRNENLVCPDKKTEIVVATPVPDYPTAKAAINYVFDQSQAKGYKTVKLLGEEANTKAYMNYMVCPKLKGFYNVGHGSTSGILLADGVLSNTAFQTLLKDKLREHVVVLFNSCQVDNDPLKSSITEQADAQKYAGGISNLRIGPSEEASKCFWDAGFAREKLTLAMKTCNEKYDDKDNFGIGGHGSDKLRLAAYV